MTEDQYDDHRDSAQYRTGPWNRAAVSGGRSQHCNCVLPRQAWIRLGLLLRVVLCQREPQRLCDSSQMCSKTVRDRAHRKQHEHLDAYISVTGVASLHDELWSRGALIAKPLEERPWSSKDFYVEDPDEYIL